MPETSGAGLPLCKVVVVGDSAVGKTALVTRYFHNTFERFTPATLGAGYVEKQVTLDDGETVLLTMLDAAGNERFRPLTQMYYRGAHCVVFVYSVTNEASFLAMADWILDYQEKMRVSIADADRIPIVLLGNKEDDTFGRRVSTDAGMTWSRIRGNMPFFEVSALDGTNVEEAFHYIVHLAAQQMRLASVKNEELIRLHEKRERSRKHWTKRCIIL